MKTKTIESVQAKMAGLLNARNKEAADLTAIIDEEKAAIAVAENGMTEATDKGDLQAYQTAKKKRSDAMDGLEMHTARLHKLTQEPLINESEYKEMIKNINLELDSNIAAAQAKLKTMAEDMAAVGEELKEAGNRANALMEDVQRDLYLNSDRKVGENGRFMGRPVHSDKYFQTVNWSICAMQHNVYGELIGRRQPAIRKE